MYKSKKAPDLYGLIKNLNNPQFDCSDDWFINNNIFNYEYITLYNNQFNENIELKSIFDRIERIPNELKALNLINI